MSRQKFESCQNQVERARDVREVERLDEQRRVAELPTPAAAEEAP
jgi:hypothetical protein